MLKPLDYDMGILPDYVLENVERAYGFRRLNIYPYIGVNGIPVPLNKRSETSRKIVIETDNSYYMLKEIPWYIEDIESISNLLSLQQKIHSRTKLVPYIKNIEGSENLYVKIYGKNYFIMEFVQGKSWRYLESQSFSAGKALKQFHQATLGFIDNTKLNSLSLIDGTKGIINLLFKKYRTDKTLLPPDEKKQLKEIINLTNKIFREKHKDVLSLGYGKVRTLVHGDYNPNNMTFDEENIVKAIYDLDNLCIDDPIHDIAEGLVDFSIMNYLPNSSRFKSIDCYPKKDLFKSFYYGYFHNRPNPRVRELIPKCISLVIIEFICLGLLRNDWGTREAIDYLKKIDFIEYKVKNILENYD